MMTGAVRPFSPSSLSTRVFRTLTICTAIYFSLRSRMRPSLSFEKSWRSRRIVLMLVRCVRGRSSSRETTRRLLTMRRRRQRMIRGCLWPSSSTGGRWLRPATLLAACRIWKTYCGVNQEIWRPIWGWSRPTRRWDEAKTLDGNDFFACLSHKKERLRLRPRSPRLLISLLLISLSAVAQASRKQHGVTCATCHEEQALPQPATQMAHAMETAQHNNVLARHPSLTFRKDGYLYSVVTKNGHSVYAVSDGRQTVSVPIVWAMGAQAQTWVLERNGNLYESRVSYYPSIQGLEITTGDEQLMPKTVDEAVGRPIGTDEAKACFNCHATNAIGRHQLDLKGLHPGISCERCHLGAQAHATDMT